jgi:hypothetical protein
LSEGNIPMLRIDEVVVAPRLNAVNLSRFVLAPQAALRSRSVIRFQECFPRSRAAVPQTNIQDLPQSLFRLLRQNRRDDLNAALMTVAS